MALKACFGLVALALLGFSTPAAQDARAAWKLQVVEVRTASTELRPAPPLGIQLRVVRPLHVEAQPDLPRTSQIAQIRLTNVSNRVQVLRWDLAESAHLVLPNRRVIRPIGHRLFGLSENSLAVNGVLVVVPPGVFVQFHPVFLIDRIPAGTRLVLHPAGDAPVRSHARRRRVR